MCPLVLGCEFLSVCVCICGIPVMFAAFNDILWTHHLASPCNNEEVYIANCVWGGEGVDGCVCVCVCVCVGGWVGGWVWVWV